MKFQTYFCQSNLSQLETTELRVTRGSISVTIPTFLTLSRMLHSYITHKTNKAVDYVQAKCEQKLILGQTQRKDTNK